MKKASSLTVILLFVILMSCNHIDSQWVLQSYDKGKRYVFSQNGVDYQATCFGVGHPVIENGLPDPNPDALPPNIAYSEADCGDILSYLHKPIPNFRRVYGTLLLFDEGQNQKLEFEIKDAK
ncbi:MAG: hypothetical protein ACRD5R_07445 [Candidatus Acidiferrales bacterium]